MGTMLQNQQVRPALSKKTKRALSGHVTVPGDKSISHRALMLASQTIGTSRITGLLEGEDVLRTAQALRLLGVTITRQEDHSWEVQGVGVGGFREPAEVLDMGNAGTGTRLMMGLLASYPFSSFLTGDASLRSRPMKRVTLPLSQMGARFHSRSGDRLPLMVEGSENLLPVTYTLPVASAQVKSAILLAGLNTAGETSVIEPQPTRDHTERMLKSMGAELRSEMTEAGLKITLKGYPSLHPQEFDVPGDPSSAAFLVVAALVVPGSDITLRNICLNPLRTGLFETLKEMGADITYSNNREVAGDNVADMRVRHSALHGVEVPAERAPSMIDEYPVLSIAASCAEGTTLMRGLEELRVKESDRLAAMEAGLKANGVSCHATADSLAVTGGAVAGGGQVATHLDHRIAMSFLILGLVAGHPVQVDDTTMIHTSFPGFTLLMNSLGADIA